MVTTFGGLCFLIGTSYCCFLTEEDVKLYTQDTQGQTKVTIKKNTPVM